MKRNYISILPVVLILIAVGSVVVLTGQQPTTVGPYTQAQVDAGRTAYQANCASCHGADLGGRNDAAQLAGSLFMGSFGGRTTSDLVGFMRGAMPPGNPGGLGDNTYLNIAAFILDSNGARSGAQALTLATAVGIRSIATGQARLQVAQAAPGRGRGGRGGDAGAPLGGRAEAPVPATPRGLTVAGEVKNYDAHYGRHVTQSRSERLADDPPRLPCQQLQRAEPDHDRERQGSAIALGVGHERGDQSGGSPGA